MPTIAPLFIVILGNFLFLGVFQIVWSVLGIVFHSIVICLYQFLGFVKYFLRTLLDYFDFIFLFCCGRVPEYSGCIAWKVFTSQDLQQHKNQNLLNNNNRKAYSSSSKSKQERVLQEQAAAAAAVYDDP